MESEGWIEVVGPRLEEFIEAVMGHKDSGGWSAGSILISGGKDRPYEWYAGYATGLMEFHLALHRTIKQRNKILEKVKNGNKENQSD